MDGTLQGPLPERLLQVFELLRIATQRRIPGLRAACCWWVGGWVAGWVGGGGGRRRGCGTTSDVGV